MTRDQNLKKILADRILEAQERVTARMAAAESIQEGYDAVIAFCREYFQAEAAALFVQDADGRLLRAVAAAGYGKNLLARDAAYEPNQGITGNVWQKGEVVRCESHEEMLNHKWRRGKYDVEQWGAEGRCQNLVFVPVQLGARIFGVLKVENRSAEGRYVPFDEGDVATLRSVAAAISMAVQSARLREQHIKRAGQNEFTASVIQYRTDEVELELSLDERHLDGPIIERDGTSAPRMKIAPWYRQNPEGWLALTAAVRQRYRHLDGFLEHLDRNGGYSVDPEEWPRGLSVREHRRRLESRDPPFHVQAMQGAGDLTMNLCTIGIVHGQLVVPSEEIARVQRSAATSDVYSCLLKTTTGMDRFGIRDVVVDYSQDPPRVSLRNSDGSPSSLGLPQVAMALSGRQLIKGGELVPLRQVVGRFGDLRHVFGLPQLHGTFFGTNEAQDLYFGEAQLVNSPTLAVAALEGPVSLDTMYVPPGTTEPLGADPAQVIQRLTRAGYREVLGREPARPGEFCRPGPKGSNFLVFLSRAYYPLTMVGLDARRENVFLMAISGQSGRFSLTVPDAARLFRDRFDVSDALLIDEGVDVFQQVGDLQPIRMNRRQVRAVLAVGILAP
ncbi:MAG: GAF domain-containing protein [Pseudomonadota bacterium]